MRLPSSTQSIPKFAAIAIPGWHHHGFPQPARRQQLRLRGDSSRPGPKPRGKLAQTTARQQLLSTSCKLGCSACKKTSLQPSPTSKQKYAGARELRLFLDVSKTDRALQPKSESNRPRKAWGLSNFFAANKPRQVPLTIIDPATGKILAQHRQHPNQIQPTQKFLTLQISTE